MEFGQITQGLRADILAQAAGQGMNVTQLLESGVSFADIMLMIVQNQQQADMSAMTTASEFPHVTENQQNMTETQISLMQNFREMSQVPQNLNIQNAADVSEFLNVQNMSQKPHTQQNTVDLEQISQLFNAGESKQSLNVQSDVQAVQSLSKEILNLSEAQQDVQLQYGQSDVQMTVQFSEIQSDVQDKLFVSKEQPELSEMQQMPQFPNVKQNVQEILHIPNVQENQQISDIQTNMQEVAQIPSNELNVQETLWFTNKQPNVQEKPHSEQQDISDTQEMLNSQSIEKNVTELPKTLKNFENSEYIQNKAEAFNKHIVQTHDIKFMSQPAPVKTADCSEVKSNLSAESILQDNAASKKLAEILEIISPEILKTSENTSSYTNNSFMNDLISEFATEGEVKDSFDISDSILKVDPLQLAGLLDFIGTGNSIPSVSDISGNEMLRSFETVKAVNPMADKLLFNPEEMIKSSEMEIVSYIPAEKNSQQSFSEHKNQASDGDTIDFARTMKDVRENVKTEITDDAAKFNEITNSMVNSNPDEIAQKIDISFDRAYAELEMNKAKYGTSDEQMYKGISENLEKGRSEFTVKLRPEGLGEILVKLVSDEGGKAVLSLVASSEKTAELLNRDLASLQTSLNQHNVEIENSSVKTAETVMHAETAFDQFNERRQDEAQQQNHFRQLKNKLGDISDRNASFEAETEAVKSVSSDSALNIKI